MIPINMVSMYEGRRSMMDDNKITYLCTRDTKYIDEFSKLVQEKYWKAFKVEKFSEFENKRYFDEHPEAHMFLAFKQGRCMAGFIGHVNISTPTEKRPFGEQLAMCHPFLRELNLLDKPSGTMFRLSAANDSASLKVTGGLMSFAFKKTIEMGAYYFYSFIDGQTRIRLYERYSKNNGMDFYHKKEFSIRLDDEYGGGKAEFILVDFKITKK